MDGGATAWADNGRKLETGSREETPIGLEEARSKSKLLSPQELNAAKPASIIFVDTSQDFSTGGIEASTTLIRAFDYYASEGEVAQTVAIASRNTDVNTV